MSSREQPAALTAVYGSGVAHLSSDSSGRCITTAGLLVVLGAPSVSCPLVPAGRGQPYLLCLRTAPGLRLHVNNGPWWTCSRPAAGDRPGSGGERGGVLSC